MKRVWCLYRVSSKKQVSKDDDIPAQREQCHSFIESKKEWKLTKELYEKGVSAYSKSADERDEMVVIKKGAIKKEFDVLLVQYFDRLGRQDEIAYMVDFLIKKQGIEVWSALEGQRTIESHIDKLTNYIDFWRAEGESVKISDKVRSNKKSLSAKGSFQGGSPPIGYKLMITDKEHWKTTGKYLSELVVDEDEGALVRLIFELYIDRHMGYRKIVDYLNSNGFRNRDGEVYGVSTIQRILVNPIYIGRKRYKAFDGEEGDTQPYNEKLRIVSDKQFKEAERIREKRRDKLLDQDKEGIPLAGKLMVSGLAFCKYCGAKLSGNYLYRKYKYKDGHYTTTIYRYRCPLNKGKINCNHEQNIWGAKKYDTIILNHVKTVLSQLDLDIFINSSIKQKQIMIKQKEQNIKKLKKEYNTLKSEHSTLSSEIAKSLLKKSMFTPEQLSDAINGVNEKMRKVEEDLNHLETEVAFEKGSYSDVNYIAEEVKNWQPKFDRADDNLKKAMLSRIIEQVHFGKGTVEITFNLTLQECLQHQFAKQS